ncbi:MAG: hypothetical protein J7K94_07335 [Dehalococcoidia bacterium]|nr:hypothetical protein [Dehalococcoidia bacterium]
MKLLSRLMIAVIIGLMAIPVAATPVAAASVFELSEEEGYVGDTIRVTGESDYGYVYIYYEFYNEDMEDWDYLEAETGHLYGDPSDEYYLYNVEIVIPESCAGEHDILICYPNDPEDDIDSVTFTVQPSIEINKDEGAAGTTVEVSGEGWATDESEIEIRFYLTDPGTTHYDTSSYYEVVASESITVDDYGNWEDVTFTVPRASKGDHWIYAVGDKSAENNIASDGIKGVKFEVLPEISLGSVSGSPGDVVTVTGSGFAEDEDSIKIIFDGEDVTTGIEADENGLWEEDFTVPGDVPKGTYDVTAEGESTSEEDIEAVEFTVVPGIRINPISGHVGTSITVSGSAFPGNEQATVTYDGIDKGSVTANSEGVLPPVTFEATNTQATHVVEHPVVVTCGSTTVSVNFTMESEPPPVPEPIAPEAGSRSGFLGKQKVAFEWTSVTDPSGVTYDLQISKSEDFAETLVSITGLTEDSCVLSSEEALDYGTYYWRVKAIDGARNESNWSTADILKVDFLPLWASITIIALIVVLIGALVYLFVIRKRGDYYD